jgi:hypothetical protein
LRFFYCRWVIRLGYHFKSRGGSDIDVAEYSDCGGECAGFEAGSVKNSRPDMFLETCQDLLAKALYKMDNLNLHKLKDLRSPNLYKLREIIILPNVMYKNLPINHKLPRAVDISEHLQQGKVLIMYGARQVGKTTLVKMFLEQSDLNHQFYTGDDLSFSADFAKVNFGS